MHTHAHTHTVASLVNVFSCVLAAPATSSAAKSDPAEDPTKYHTPEYFQHNAFSFYDLDVALGKYRLPQPSKYDPLKPKK